MSQQQMGGQPLFVLNEDSSRTSGRDARQSNIAAGKAISEAVRTTLGPRGMDKMLVKDENVVITNDGATILEKMDIEHPAAEMIVEVAQSQEDEVGDGTTTASILTGRLLGEAEDLFDDDVHPTTIVEGYTLAAQFAREAIDDLTLDEEIDEEVLRRVAESAMTGKGTGGMATERLAEIVVDAVQIAREGDAVSNDDITLETQSGASSTATELLEGITLDEDPAHPQMPDRVDDANVAVLDVELAPKDSDFDAEYSIDTVDQLTQAQESERAEVEQYVEKVLDTGADVIFTSEDVDGRVADLLGREGLLVFEDLTNNDTSRVANAVGANRVGDLNDVDEADLGYVETVRREVQSKWDAPVFIEGGEAAGVVTIYIRGGTRHVAHEIKRSVSDALDVVVSAIGGSGVVPGAGASEVAIADHIRDQAASVEGRKQLAVEAFADAVEAIPRTLAENAGADPIDALVDLRAVHEERGRAGIIAVGREAEVGDPVEEGVLDPAAVKHEAIESATEAATMIVRIDDVIAAN